MSNTSEIAAQILNGFKEYREMFQHIAREAKDCFEQSQWKKLQDLSSQRIDLYGIKVKSGCRCSLPAQPMWGGGGRMLSRKYADLVSVRADTELAETFFNSVYSRIEGDHPSAQAQLFIPRKRPESPGSKNICPAPLTE